MNKPRLQSSEANREVERIDNQIKGIQEGIQKVASQDRASIPVAETEEQTKLSKKELTNYDAPVIKYVKAFADKAKLPEKWRAERDHDWELIKVVCENCEIVGEMIEVTTHKWPGDPWAFWQIPVNTPVYIPRHVAKQIHDCHYIRYVQTDPNTDAVWFEEKTGIRGARPEKRNRLDCRLVGAGF